MFGENILITKRTEWDGKVETFVEEFDDLKTAKKTWRDTFKAIVEMKEDFKSVEILLLTHGGSQVDSLGHDHSRVARASIRV